MIGFGEATILLEFGLIRSELYCSCVSIRLAIVTARIFVDTAEFFDFCRCSCCFFLGACLGFDHVSVETAFVGEDARLRFQRVGAVAVGTIVSIVKTFEAVFVRVTNSIVFSGGESGGSSGGDFDGGGSSFVDLGVTPTTGRMFRGVDCSMEHAD